MTSQPPFDPHLPKPGWYQDPGGQQVLRWWDGRQWSQHTQPLPDPSPPSFLAPQPQPEGRSRPRRGSHRIRIAAAVIGGLAVALIVIAALSGSHPAPASSPGIAAVSAPAAASSSAAPPPPTKVEFIVSGTAPDGIDITYGPSGSNLSGPSTLDGTATMSVPFNASAEYYAMDAQLQGGGDITCKIVVTGPGDNPATVSSGAASGGYNICSAQAAPENNGLSWQNEN
jgi:hypothetical protein